MDHDNTPTNGLLVGRPVNRIEDRRMLSGTSAFVDDVARPDLLHAAILRSNVAHGTIRSIDVADALALPGVRAVITAADIGPDVPRIPLRLAPFASFPPYLQPVIAHGKVRYVGEPLAVIVAQTRAIAEDALDLVSVEIDPLPAVVAHGDGTAGKALLFEDTGTNVATHYKVGLGDVEQAFATAAYRRRERFYAHRHTALPMETRGLLAEWDSVRGRLIVTGATKVTFFNRRALAPMLKMAVEDIDLVEVDVGGGFGVRGEFYPEDLLIPFAARHLRAAVKWIEDRREHLIATNHSREIACDLEIACTREGDILAMRGEIFGDMGAYIRTNGGVVPAKAAQFIPGPYRIKNVAFAVNAVMTNKTPTGTYRGPGRFEANFFRERMIDMAAHDLGLDPIAMRRRNLIREEELPYPIGGLVPYENETAYDTGDYHATLDACLSAFKWDEKRHLQGRTIDGKRHGLGFACFVESGGAGPKENARLTLGSDGMLTVAVGSSVLGQGLETVLAQIAADALGIGMARMRILHGSTTIIDEGFGTYHSRAVVMGGSAVLDAANKLRDIVLQAAATHLGRTNVELVIRDDRVEAASGAFVLLAELAQAAEKHGTPLSAYGTFGNTQRTYSYGAHAAHVAVDTNTGAVQVLDYLAVEDVGRIINPAIVHGQAIGAIVQGLGGLFMDHLIYDDEGQLLNASLADYLVPTATDFPNIRALALELRPSPSNPLGAKGAGEGGIVAVAAAGANAVAAALRPLGVEITQMPLSPDALWHTIHRLTSEAA